MREAGLPAILVGDFLSGALLLAAALANLSAFSLTRTVAWAGTYLTVTSLSLDVIREQTSEAVTGKRCLGPRVSVLILSMVAVESEMVHRRPLPGVRRRRIGHGRLHRIPPRYLLVSSQMEAVAGPPRWGLPAARCSHVAAV